MPTSGPLGTITCVSAETFCLSGSSGQIRAGGDQGLFVRDTRALNHLVVEIDGDEPAPLHGRVMGAGAARFVGYVVAHGGPAADPRLVVDRRRVVSATMTEDLRLRNYGAEALELDVEVLAGTDFAYIFDVKQGLTLSAAKAFADDGALRFEDTQADRTVTLRSDPPPDEVDGDDPRLRWRVRIEPGAQWQVALEVAFAGPAGERRPTRTWEAALEYSERTRTPWRPLALRCSDHRVTRLTRRSSLDLASLIVADPADADNRFLAAGSPWYLTLFGRDSLWSAQMALPLDVGLAGETLRVLARRQGDRHDPATEEAPGKILHEVRHGGLVGRSALPPCYFGTMDATPLWIVLLNEAWRWGLPEEQVGQLLPAMERALEWMRVDGDADGDGFLEYQRTGERGLANQGWKDSHDSISFADGRFAEPPIALCEVQGYAHAAALRGAELLDHFGRPGADGWREWAAALQARFRERFWVDDPDGSYPALALDRDKQQVDSVASNMGHLLATGIVNGEETALIARRLGSPELDSGWGLRTLSSAHPRFNPLSYHNGSVWPHDTAIAVDGLARTGHAQVAAQLVGGLLEAAPFYDYRLPELLGGESQAQGGFPLPYPAACRPQAWSAGAALFSVRSLLGIEPHLPRGRLVVRPLWPPPFQRLELTDLPLAGARVSVAVVRDKGVHVDAAADLDVEVIGAPRAG